MRNQLKSGPVASSSHSEEKYVNKIQVGLCCSIDVAPIGFGWILIAPFQFLAMWLGLSLLVGPLALISLTGDDCRLGVGEPIPPLEAEERPPKLANFRVDYKNGPRKAPEVLGDAKTVKVDETVSGAGLRGAGAQKNGNMNPKVASKGIGGPEDKGFTYEEVELLAARMRTRFLRERSMIRILIPGFWRREEVLTFRSRLLLASDWNLTVVWISRTTTMLSVKP